MNLRISIVVLVLALVVVVGYRQAKSQSQSTYNGFALVDKTGNIRHSTWKFNRTERKGTRGFLSADFRSWKASVAKKTAHWRREPRDWSAGLPARRVGDGVF